MKVLVVSNNCFSLSDSNGRTLGSLFAGWPKENVAQMCIIAKDPNWEICDNYYCIEDKVVLNAFLHCKKAKGRALHQVMDGNLDACKQQDTVRPKIGQKTIIKILLRHLVWSNKRWDTPGFDQWVDDFCPDAVLLQMGDSGFMFNIALYLSQSRNIPLMMFCTEGYYFFDKNCFSKSRLDFLIYPMYRKLYRRTVRNTLSKMKYAVYGNSLLYEDYSKEFGLSGEVIYTGSYLEFVKKQRLSEPPRISYLGNLGLDRDSAIIEVGEVLHCLNPDYKIDVYGKADDAMQKLFDLAPGVEYKGLVSYEEVKRVIGDSDILFHVETENGYKEHQLQYAFSTKIADSISSGKCFVLYAPKELACSKYIVESGAGWFASDKFQLRRTIEEIITDSNSRDAVLRCARETAESNHNMTKNAARFQEILNRL